MPTGMSLPSFGSATSRGRRVSQANKGVNGVGKKMKPLRFSA